MPNTDVTSADIEYIHEGRRYLGFMARPSGEGTCAAVLVAHEGPGLDDHAKQRALRLAALGYIAFALDYHGDGVPVPFAEVRAHLAPLIASPELTRGRAAAALAVLLAEPRTDPSRVGAIGFCFGGTMMLELARGGADLRAVVGFHSGLGTTQPDDARQITGAILVCIGADDPMIPPAQRAAFEQEMTAGGVDWRMNVYGGAVHSFTNSRADALGIPGIAFHAATDDRSWRAMLDLFDERLS
jgi:dienelactone hydrolase